MSLQRYVVEATPFVGDGGQSSVTSVTIDETLLTQLCQDEDGCSITLGMRNWDETLPADFVNYIGPSKFYIGPIDAGDDKRKWATYWWNGVIGPATDGDGARNDPFSAFDCYFSDDQWVHGQEQSDTALGFDLLNWPGNYPADLCAHV